MDLIVKRIIKIFDEQAEAIFNSIDKMAERVRKVGGMTIRSISHIGQLQTIEDDNSTIVSPGEMVRILMEDNGHIAKMIRDAINGLRREPGLSY